MAKKKKVKASPRRISARSWFLIAGFVAVGAVAIYASAATRVSDVLMRSNSLAVGYSQNKPTVAAKASVEAETTYEARSRAIDISKKGMLFCTPEDQGVVTQRALSLEEKREVAEKIYNTAPTVDLSSVPVQSDLNEKTLYVDTTVPNEQAKVYAEGAFKDYLAQSVALLERLCSVPGQPITDEEIEKLSLHTQEELTESTAQQLNNILFPKASAGGTSPKYAGLDTAAENIQHVRLTDARKKAGIASTYRIGCLDNAAREWAREMARTYWLRHSTPINVIMERHCGNAWQRLGENVGISGTVITDSPENSHKVSNIIFDAFMNSPGHRANILDARYNKHGMGAYKTTDGRRIYISQVYWR